MNKQLRIFASLAYILALTVLALYFILYTVSPVLRLAILLLTVILTYFASLLLSKTLGDKSSKRLMKITFTVFFVLYIFFLVTLVLFDDYFGRVGIANIPKWSIEAFSEYFGSSVNFVPFRTVSEFVAGAFTKALAPRAFFINIFGNLAAFAPLSFFYPLLFDKLSGFKHFFFATVATVSCVELLQMLLLTGACDIDDLILNVAGACFTYYLLHIDIFKRQINKITELKY